MASYSCPVLNLSSIGLISSAQIMLREKGDVLAVRLGGDKRVTSCLSTA